MFRFTKIAAALSLAGMSPQQIEALEFHQATALGALMHLKNGQAYQQSMPLFT